MKICSVMTKTNNPRRIALGVTGASGIIYARMLAEVVLRELPEAELHLVLTPDARKVACHELKLSEFTLQGFLPGGNTANVVEHDSSDLSSPLSSGSFRLDAVVICPCSMNTLGAVASGLSPTLVARMAAVALKERTPLVVVPRETPLSLIHLRNMVAVAEAGAMILPAMPGFYHTPETIEELAQHLVMKILDLLNLPHTLNCRWEKVE